MASTSGSTKKEGTMTERDEEQEKDNDDDGSSLHNTPTRKERTTVALHHSIAWTIATTMRQTTAAYHMANLTGLIIQHTGLEDSAPIVQNAIC